VLPRVPDPASVPTLAIVVPTLGADPGMLGRAVSSARPWADELIVVSQAPGERRRAVDAALAAAGALVIDDPGTGAARARNLGFARVTAEWVLFLDDDAELLPTFADVVAVLGRARESLISWRVVSPAGVPISGFYRRDEPITPFNHWRLTREHNTLWRSDHLRRLGGFDDRLGPGRWAGAEECSDLVMRLLASGRRARYLATTASVHPDSAGLAVPKARAYGRGAGRVMRTHLSHPVAWPWILRTIGGLGSIVLPRRFHRFSRRAKSARAHGVIEGILRAGAR
jgi:hypothetical protein